MTVQSIDQLVQLLEDETVYNYLQYLVKQDEEEIEVEESKLINTLELFAFGTIHDYLKYKQHFIDLEQQSPLRNKGLLKLVKLSVISFVNDNDGFKSKIPISTVLSDPAYDIGHGLTLIDYEFDQLVIEMIDENLVEVKIDDESLLLVRSIKLRDSYSKSLYNLRVFDEFADIPNRSLTHALNNLQHWYNDKLIPTKEGLQLNKPRHSASKPEIMVQHDSVSSPISIDLDVKENTRKRKTPDHAG